MRGFPLLNGAFIVMALGLVLLPLLRLTSSDAGSTKPSAPTMPQPSGIATGISVRYAHAPTSLTLSHLGKTLWQTTSVAEIDAGREVPLILGSEGIDLLLAVIWTEGTPATAIGITLQPEGLAEQSQVLWGEGSVEDVLTFVWK